MATCDRCDGDGKAHGSDRPFEWSGPGTWPGPCPKCKGSGSQEGNTQSSDVKAHNDWVESLKEDVEFEPLLQFLDRLKE
jgi:DnaJ-class molecular chaperone